MSPAAVIRAGVERGDPFAISSDLRDDALDRLALAVAAAPLVEESDLNYVMPHRADLSPFELRALELASHGLNVEESAVVAHVAYETIKAQLKASRRRLRAKNTTHAVAEALRQGLIA